MTTVLSAADVHRLVGMAAAIEAVAEALEDLAKGLLEMPPRMAFGGRSLLMTAHHRGAGTTVVKALGLHPGRLPAISGRVIWLDEQGELVMDAEPVTTLRTGAIVGLATRALAATDARRLAVIGAGAQAPDQVRAVATVRAIDTIVVHDRTQARAHELVHRLGPELPTVDLRVAASPAEAVASADVVCCSTPVTEPLFALEDLPPHVHVNAIGSFRRGMRELPIELLGAATAVVVDHVPAAQAEAGEIIHALEAGVLRVGALRELSDVGGAPPGGRTVFKTVGVAAQDWAVASLVAAALER